MSQYPRRVLVGVKASCTSSRYNPPKFQYPRRVLVGVKRNSIFVGKGFLVFQYPRRVLVGVKEGEGVSFIIIEGVSVPSTGFSWSEATI